jgi:hypothetical protein
MSASTSLVRLLDMVRIDCPGVSDGILRKTLFNTLREFFRRTNIWLFEMPVYITPDTNDYILNTCQNANVIRLMSLDKPQYFPSDPIQYIPGCPPQFIQYPTTIPGGETQNPFPRVPRDGGLLNAGGKCPILRIFWNPGNNDVWIATLALSVADPVDGRGIPSDMPDWIIDKYFDYIAQGIAGKLMLSPNKPYSSPKLAEYNMRKFHEGVGLARTENRHLFAYGSQRWMYPQTFGTPFKHKAV